MEKDFANFGLAGFTKPKADPWIPINEKTKIRQTTNKGRRTSIRE
jgi:hypothetical protein